MRIGIIGSGYVGLVSGACFADFGHSVVCVDSDESKIAALRRGAIPIYEPGLEQVIADNSGSGRLVFSTDLAGAVEGSDVVFIAVGTPSRRGDGHADLSYVHDAARAIAAAIEGFTLVVTKSTVPVGTGDEIDRIIRDANPRADIAVVSNPEFLREGAAIEDFRRPDRIVVGLEDERARAVMSAVYRPLQGVPILFTGRRTAELVKYAANAFLATKLTFINEIADFCEKAGADVRDVALGIGLDHRIGRDYLRVGPGYGGSCLPKDTLSLIRSAHELDSPLRIVETTVAVNDARKATMLQKVIGACGGDVRGKTIAVLGLTFAPNTDDLRSSPALDLIPSLQGEGALTAAYDPVGMDAARPLLPDVRFGRSAYDVAEGADAVVLVTEWNEFRSLDLDRLRAVMRTPVLVDLRNIYSRRDVEAKGFAYECVGRPAGAEAAE